MSLPTSHEHSTSESSATSAVRTPYEPWRQPAPGTRRTHLPAITRIAQNALIDLRFGALLGGTYLSNRDASCSDYALLDQIFAGRITNEDVLVDVGSGGGRVINHWLRRGHSGKIYGVESNSSLSTKSRRRLRNFANVTIVGADAAMDLPDNGTVYYLFNPFDGDTMMRFAARLAASMARNPRLITVLYFNCKHVDVFELDPRFSVSSIQRITHQNGTGQDLATIRTSPTTTSESSQE